MIGVILALTSAAAYGVSDFLGGLASRRVAALRVILVSYPLSAVIVTVLAVVVGGTPSWHAMLFGAASGLALALAMWWFYIALAEGPMSVVSPMTAVLVAGIPVIVGVALGERPSVISFVGVGLAIVAVLLVSREPTDAAPGTDPAIPGMLAPGHVALAPAPRFTRRVAWFTIGSGTFFALAFIFVHQIEAGTGLWPLVASRGVASVIVIAVAVATRQHGLLPRGIVGIAVIIALLDVTANVTMLYAFQGGLLSLVSVLIALYPAVTVLLAVLVLKERVGRLQVAGMGLALAAIAAIAING
ncbi:EamA family transporter [Cryobacterium melibiosiphilum]|uniref:EamA family transporter n=1 Tax=Cryobacterium melibiosiphilum TaxID=995039 RepID=UPI0018F4C3D8|nr:EamA family transporter [Cryobacterium melibiosiphilum]